MLQLFASLNPLSQNSGLIVTLAVNLVQLFTSAISVTPSYIHLQTNGRHTTISFIFPCGYLYSAGFRFLFVYIADVILIRYIQSLSITYMIIQATNAQWFEFVDTLGNALTNPWTTWVVVPKLLYRTKGLEMLITVLMEFSTQFTFFLTNTVTTFIASY